MVRRISEILWTRAGLRPESRIFLAARLCKMLKFVLFALLIPFVTLIRWLGICLFGREYLGWLRMLADW